MADILRYPNEAESVWLLANTQNPLMRDISKQHEMEASPPHLAWMMIIESCIMMGLLIWGRFELLLGGVSHITHKALVLITGPSASRW